MTRRLIPISQLAAYAADPEGFVDRGGKPANEPGARFGTAYHEGFARTEVKQASRPPYMLLAFIVLLILLAVWWVLP